MRQGQEGRAANEEREVGEEEEESVGVLARPEATDETDSKHRTGAVCNIYFFN